MGEGGWLWYIHNLSQTGRRCSCVSFSLHSLSSLFSVYLLSRFRHIAVSLLIMPTQRNWSSKLIITFHFIKLGSAPRPLTHRFVPPPLATLALLATTEETAVRPHATSTDQHDHPILRQQHRGWHPVHRCLCRLVHPSATTEEAAVHAGATAADQWDPPFLHWQWRGPSRPVHHHHHCCPPPVRAKETEVRAGATAADQHDHPPLLVTPKLPPRPLPPPLPCPPELPRSAAHCAYVCASRCSFDAKHPGCNRKGQGARRRHKRPRTGPACRSPDAEPLGHNQGVLEPKTHIVLLFSTEHWLLNIVNHPE